ncbi:Crp/Fnr family transcriptional regulator [Brevibacillus fluminis]|uniref:Crp/Fnr family transcriptional regulator n=1 Tax=Brevibacillus fluminis TaxID=511487 RepID=A0A3M8D992_9BACL|nr:Crp/Fnr family transcriptional regulator [Brevibacillus fluminis]RNB84710.1 Crp/Fnr family transcriptional regulator [Brevibacillus fluminis]
MRNDQIEEVIQLFPFLSAISTNDWNQEGVEIVSLPVHFVIPEGKLLNHAALILEGAVRMSRLGTNGREVTLYRLTNGECCPLMMASILGESAYEASACIEKPTRALVIPVPLFFVWLDTYKSFRQFVFQTFAKRLILMSNLIDSMKFKSIRTRIAEYVLEKTTDECNVLTITHDQLSMELGTVREVISRTLKGMEREGMLRLGRGQITHIQRHQLLTAIE